MTAIKLKMPALRLFAMFESDLPKQAAQASRLGGAASHAKTAAAKSNFKRFIDS